MAVPTRLPRRIVTDRLVLRHWTLQDAPVLTESVTANLDHLRPWMPWAATEPVSLPERIALIERWQASWEAGGDSVFGVFCDGKAIGGTGLHRRLGPKVLEIGYWIDVAHTGNGYATEVVRALTAAAFAVPGIDRVEIHHDEANHASAAIPHRLGFTLARKEVREPTAPAEIGVECQWVMRRLDWPPAA